MAKLPEMEQLRRIYIVGVPGSGKTTLAHLLGKRLGIPVHELDRVAFDGPEYAWRHEQERIQDVQTIARQGSWVSEGMWLGWTDELLRSSDLIIWLDGLTWMEATRRIVMRFGSFGFSKARTEQGIRKFARFRDYWRHFRQLLGVIQRTRRYYQGRPVTARSQPNVPHVHNRAETERHLAAYQEKLVRITDENNLSGLVERLASPHAGRTAFGDDSTERPLVSIIINNYNYAAFLHETIESALAQSYPAVEVIVVDDGSTDASRDIISGYENLITPVLKENGGQASAFNAGFLCSQGKVVIFLDADDVLLPGTAQRVVDAFSSAPDTAKVMYRMEVIDEKGNRTGQVKPDLHLPLRSGNVSKQVLTFPFDMTWMATSGNAFAAQVLDRVLPMPEAPYRTLADFYLSHVTSLFGPVIFLPQIGAYYRVHGGNTYELSAAQVSLEHIRQTIEFAEETHLHIKDFADRLALPARPAKPQDMLSVSIIVKRMISLKLCPAEHPLPRDSAARLFGLGVKASLRRFDVTWSMKFLYMGWFAILLLAPRRFTPQLALFFSFPEKRSALNGLLRRLHRKI